MSGNDTLNIPFDQYQRYKKSTEIIELLRQKSEIFSVLEIGANEHKNLEKFLPNDEIKYLDIALSDTMKNDPQYILGDATNMSQFNDGYFDIVIALDVFEHIPNEKRRDFLDELNRVSNKLFILAGPFDTEEVHETEVRVNEYFKVKFGQDYIWLKEHIENKLPSLPETLTYLKNKDLNLANFSHGSLEMWEKLIQCHFEVAGNMNLQAYRLLIDQYYNQHIYINDISNHNYRQFIIGQKESFVDIAPLFSSNIEERKKDFNDKFDFLIQSLNHLSMLKENQLVQQQIQEKDRQLLEKDRQIQEKDRQIQEKDRQIQEKDRQIHNQNLTIEHLNNIAQSMRIKNRIKRVIKKVVPVKVWKILKYVRHNPSAVRLGLYTLKTQGLGSLLNKIEKVDHLPAHRVNNSYNYLEPVLTDDIKKEIDSFGYKPLVSIIMPVYNVDPKWLELAIKSIENQWYENWELCISDDKSTNQKTIDFLKGIDNPKIKIKFLEKNQNISVASNEALKFASGDYIGLMDNDDEITSDALYEVVKAINETGAEFIYSDEDKLEMDGTFSDPHFKPDFAPDMFHSQNYISHFGVIKKDLIEKVDGFTEGLEGAQDYDLYLKVLEHTDKISHISKVLYHWRKIPGSTAADFDDKSYAQEAGKKALENSMQRRNIDAKVLNGKYPGTYKIEYFIKDNPLVSIVIPFKDKPELLKMCIESILGKSTYKNFEIIGISNNSEEESIFEEMKRLESLDKRIRFYEYNVPFNYSKINNYAVNQYAKGEYIILLNNDIEIITTEWIEELLMYAQREGVGCVGAKLYYPNDLIQHAGVVVGIGGIAGHSHKYFTKNTMGYFSRLEIVQNVSAVTAACLMVKKAIYEEVNGFNEQNLKVAFNDVDFCLRVQEKGYLNIFTPYCEAYHHESISRGQEDSPEKIKRFNSEVAFMQKRHEHILQSGDPYYNKNLTLDREDFSLR